MIHSLFVRNESEMITTTIMVNGCGRCDPRGYGVEKGKRVEKSITRLGKTTVQQDSVLTNERTKLGLSLNDQMTFYYLRQEIWLTHFCIFRVISSLMKEQSSQEPKAKTGCCTSITNNEEQNTIRQTKKKPPSTSKARETPTICPYCDLYT